jgi:putative pyoverdin transport system ATP-binding/permease protein
MNLINFLLRTSWVSLTLAVVAGLISGATNAGLIAIINQALLIEPSVIALAWSFAALCLLQFLMNFSSEALLIRISQRAVYNLRLLLSNQILASPLLHLEQLGIHRLLASLTNDISTISDAILKIPFFCVNIATVIGCVIYLGTLSWMPLLWILGFLALGIFSYHFPTIRATNLLELARQREDKLFNHFRAITEGVKELKLNSQRRDAFFSQELQPTITKYRDNQVVGLTMLSAAAAWGDLLAFGLIGLLLFVLSSWQNISSAILSSYVLTSVYLVGPLAFCMEILPDLVKANVAFSKVKSLGLSLTNNSTRGKLITPVEQISSWQSLKLVGVTHAYYREKEFSRFVLGPIDLTLYPGELVFIIGGNGSGKSTLVKLLTGLYMPETGEIYLDDKLITDKNREWYRQYFSVVFSDFYLFERTLGLGGSDLDSQIQDYLVKLQLEHKVQIKNGKLSTTALSQGQRKRLALLTAYLENRPIYVFDEWAADQDPIFKEIFYTQLLPELKKKGKTVLVVSHDDRYFYLAERVVKLEDGKLNAIVPQKTVSS